MRGNREALGIAVALVFAGVVSLLGARLLRWARRRVQAVLQAFKGLLPDRFPCVATLLAFAAWLGVSEVLVALRPLGEPFLANLSTPLGFLPRRARGSGRGGAYQQPVGPDPPGVAA